MENLIGKEENIELARENRYVVYSDVEFIKDTEWLVESVKPNHDKHELILTMVEILKEGEKMLFEKIPEPNGKKFNIDCVIINSVGTKMYTRRYYDCVVSEIYGGELSYLSNKALRTNVVCIYDREEYIPIEKN